MSNLQKRLLLIGVSLASIVLLILLFSGKGSKSSPEFKGIDEVSDTASDLGDRYEITPKAKSELNLPPVDLAFLERDLARSDLAATLAELPQLEHTNQLAIPTAQADELNAASKSLPAAENESEIPLLPPVKSENANDSSQETVKPVTYENERGTNDFPLTPQSVVSAPADDNEFEIPEMTGPNMGTARSGHQPTQSESQATVGQLPTLPMKEQSPRVASLPPAHQMLPADSTHESLSERVRAHEHDEVASSDQILARTTTLPPAIATQIRQRLDYGTSLARRGAFASAEEIYFQVIRLIAETKDSQLGEREFTTRLAKGLTALEEAEDFIASDLRTRVRINVETIIQGHNTTVLQAQDVSGMTSIQALQWYYDYAGELIAGACDNEPVGSDALYFLGKLYATDTQYDPMNSAMRNAKSMIMHQAALEANAMNYRAANELGVLLAQYGRFDDAKELLIHSVSTYPDQIAWKNLAIVHEKLGETQLAGLAFKESKIAAEQASQRKTGAADGPIQWVDSAVFVRRGGDQRDFVDAAEHQPAENQTPPANSQRQDSAAKRTAKASSEWWKIWKR